jgi:hypothetical protein
MSMIRSRFLSLADRIEVETYVRRQREDRGGRKISDH